MKASGVNLTNGGGLKELEHFQNYLSDYKIIVYDGLNPDRFILNGNSLSNKKLYLLYDLDTEHYNVITNLKAAMAKWYICNAYGTLYGKTQAWQSFLLVYGYSTLYERSVSVLWYMQQEVLSVKCFQNNLTHKVKGKLICQWRQVCRNCSFAVTGDSKLESFKRFCNYCNKKQHSGQFCYVALLKPSKLTDRFLFVFFDTECTQDIEKHHGSFAPHMCSVDVFKVRSGGWPEWRL